MPDFDPAERAALLEEFERWQLPAASSRPGMARSPEELRQQLGQGSAVYVHQLFELLPRDEAERALLEALRCDPPRLRAPMERELRVLLAALGERVLPEVERWPEHSAPWTLVAMGSRVGRRALMGQLGTDRGRAEVIPWAEAHPEEAAGGAAEIAGSRKPFAVPAREWLAAHVALATPVVTRLALTAGDPHDRDVFRRGSPAATLRWLAQRFGREGIDAACPVEDRARLDALLDPSRDMRFTDAPFREAKWWPPPLGGADRALLESNLLPQHPAVVAMREALDPAEARATAHAIVDAFEADKSKPTYRWALTAALRLAPEAIVARVARLAWTWAKSKNRNHRNNVAWVVRWLREMETDEAIARLAIFAGGIGQATRREESRWALRAIAVGRGVSVEELVAGALPDLGLARDGSLTLDYGPRQFVVRFGIDGKPRFFDAAGKPRKSLPKPGKRDDPARAAAAWARYEDVKEDVRHLLQAERGRLEEALRTQRPWRFETLMKEAAHPVRRVLLAGLVFASEGRTFRVSNELIARDAQDEPVEVAPDAEVRVAHPLSLSPDDERAWGLALGDFELIPPFPQLDRPTFDLTVEDCEVRACESWEIPAGAVVGLLSRGWRGEWGGGGTLEGGRYDWGGGHARLWCDPFVAREAGAVGALPVGLTLEGEPPPPILLSEILLDLDRVRRKSD